MKVKGVPSEEQVARLRRGVRLDDGAHTAPAEIKKLDETETNAWFEVVLREGRNQQIRRMFDSVGHSVLKLRRVRIGPVRTEGLPVGKWRHLAPAEVARLKGGASGAKRKRGVKGEGGAAHGRRGDDRRDSKQAGAAGKKAGRVGRRARGAGHGARGV